MNIATLRIEGEDQALVQLRNALHLAADAEWRKGASKRNGGSHAKSGFNATIADASNPGEMVVVVRKFLAECKELGVVLSSGTLSTELSVGVTVGDSAQFVAFVDFTAQDLVLLGALGINLSIAAYPTSDEANVNDQAA